MTTNKIESLTEEQKALMPVVAEEWKAIGLCTDPANREKAEAGIITCYVQAGLKLPKFVWSDSPLAMFMAKHTYTKDPDVFQDQDAVNTVLTEVVSGPNDEIKSGGNGIQALISSALKDFDINSVNYGEVCFGQHDAHWLAFYDYFRLIGLEEETKQLAGLWEVAKHAGWFIPYDDVCFVSERPAECHMDGDNLHCENGPALRYPDGFSLWVLNGVRVSKEIVMTPADELNPHLLLEEDNVEIRREIVRKIGIEKICEKLGAEAVDVVGDYQLLELSMVEGNPKYLRMKNPSLEDTYHLEGVPNDTQTVADALHFRKPDALREIPVDDKEGLDWFQQGDVCVWPKDAHAVKRLPKILT